MLKIGLIWFDSVDSISIMIIVCVVGISVWCCVGEMMWVVKVSWNGRIRCDRVKVVMVMIR